MYPNLSDPNYRIESVLGSGGGGVVYKAWHNRLQKYVALKRVREPRGAGSQNAMAFSRAEADMLKDLKHANLPHVYDFLSDGSGDYTVMEYIPGRSFDEFLTDGRRFSQKQVIEWARSLSGALAYLHGRKPSILHSDIKPGNIMYLTDGSVCLIDFNIALLLEGGGADVIGRSHGYASPEQYGPQALPRDMRIMPQSSELPIVGRGVDREKDTEFLGQRYVDREKDTELLGRGQMQRAAAASPPMSSSTRERAKIRMDARSDIYSFGATLYHLLTGEKPAIASGNVKPLSSFNLGLGEALEYIVEKCMERDPRERFQSAVELHRAFLDIHKMDSRWKRQSFKVNVAIILLALMFVVSGASAAYGWMRLGEESQALYNELVHAIAASPTDYEFNRAVEMFPFRLEAFRAQALKLSEDRLHEQAIEFVDEIMATFAAFSWGDEDLLILGDIFFVQGNAWFELGDYSRAVLSYEAAVQNNPTNPEMFRDYAIALARSGSVEEAEELLADIRHMAIGNDSIQLLQGEIAFARNNFAEAVDLFDSIIRYSGSDFLRNRAFLISQDAYRRMPGRHHDEISLLRRALAELPEAYHLIIMERLADALTRAGENAFDPHAYYTEAIELFSEIVARGIPSFATQQNVGLLYQRLGYFDSARTAFFTLSQNFPDNYLPYMRLAYLSFEVQQGVDIEYRDYGEAFEWYIRARGLYEQRPRAAADDMEMLMLMRLIEELQEHGWLD